MLTPVPLLIIPFALYNIIAFLTPGLEWASILWTVTLSSGAVWQITVAEGFVAFTLLFLLFEILKSARVNSRSFIDHILSALILLVALAEFVLVPQAATSAFALMLCVMLLDVLVGITASMRAPRRARAAKPSRAPAPEAQATVSAPPAAPPPAAPVSASTVTATPPAPANETPAQTAPTAQPSPANASTDSATQKPTADVQGDTKI